MDITKEPQRIISFCTGIRGLERGIERVNPNVRTVAYVEIEAFICENLACEMEAGVLAPAPTWTDIKTFNGSPFRGKVHGIIGGYPCQPFSVAGERKGTEDPRHVWPYICTAIAAIRPVWCFFENVAGHVTMGYSEVYRSLRNMGYGVEAGIFTAEEVGAPHERERLFILAVMADMPGIGKRRLSECEPGQERSKQGNSTDINGSGEIVADTNIIGCEHEQKELAEIETYKIGQLSTGEQSGNNKQCGVEQSGISREKQLADSGLQRQEKRQKRTAGVEQCSEKELGNTNLSNEQYVRRGFGEITSEQSINSNSGSELANANSCGGGEDTQPGQLRPGSPEQSPSDSWITNEGENNQRRFDRWPARPGEEQYEWEEPRTISKEDLKSRMGTPVDGYNFREDLLRAAGNSVVEQTAALAFEYLWNEHLKNNE